jgi:hypothetical protein
MKQIKGFYFLLSLLPFIGSAVRAEEAAAVVNGEVIPRSEVLEKIEMLKKNAGAEASKIPDEKIFDYVREQSIKMLIISQAASNAKTESDPDFQKELKEIKKTFMTQHYIVKLKEKVKNELPKEKVKAMVDEMSKKEKDVTIQLMAVPVKLAERVKKALEDGKSFDELAKAYAQRGASNTETRFESTVVNSLPAEYRASFSALKTKGVLLIKSSPDVVVVIQLISKTPITNMEKLEKQVQEQLSNQAMEAVIQNIEKKAKIERKDMQGKPVAAPAPEPTGSEEAEKTAPAPAATPEAKK